MKKEQKQVLLVIDGNAIVHRAWHALPPLATKSGQIVSGAYGFTTILLSAIRQCHPTHIAATFDLAGTTFRHEAFGDYKAQREKKPDELYAQIPLIQKILEAMRIPVYTMKGFEADDVIGAISQLAPQQEKNIEVIIMTGDLDTLQLVNDNVKVLTLRKGMSDTVIYDDAAVRERYGLAPGQLIEYKALRGDPSDNIPGVKGIGEKTAAELIQKFGSIENIYESLEKNDTKAQGLKPSVREKLLASKKEAFLAKDLSTIRCDIAVPFELTVAEFHQPTREAMRSIFEELEFVKLLQQFPSSEQQMTFETVAEPQEKSTEKDVVVTVSDIVAAKKILVQCAGANTFAFRSMAEADSFAIALCDGKKTFVFPHNVVAKVAKELQDVFSSDAEKVCHDLKSAYHHFDSLGISLTGPFFDLMIASYLLHAGERRHTLEAILAYYRQIPLPEKKPHTSSSLVESPMEAAHLRHFLGLRDEFHKLLVHEKLFSVLTDIDQPLCRVLATMEHHGIAIDKKHFHELAAELEKNISSLVKKIYTHAGTEFNINSPLQLQKILFEDLHLSAEGVKKTAKNKVISTAAAELEKLRNDHPIIPLLIDYRELSKLLSTYVAPLPLLANAKDGRIHTDFQITIAATGRLSSIDPNLQNIPTAETEYGKKVRSGFVAPTGRVLVSCDYSQFELRVVAHLAKEPSMINAFKRGEDIHYRTAVEMFGEKDAAHKRRIAKVINFGILYGMGPHRLSESAGISLQEARDYIDQYFALLPNIARYVAEQERRVEKEGFVETLYGRRRYFRNFHLMNPREKAEALRQGVNMPIQGSQADLLKLAMLRVDEYLGKTYGLGADAAVKMLLQVHDELVFETEKDVLEKAMAGIRPIMESVGELSVPLAVNVAVGKRWGELEKM